MNPTAILTQSQKPSYNQVDWFDSDASEDEDYVPQFPFEQNKFISPFAKDCFMKSNVVDSDSSIESSDSSSGNSSNELDELEEQATEERNKRGRMNSLSWDINTREPFRRKLTITVKSELSPLDKVRQAINKTVDHGVETVDISHINLTEIPDEIIELKHLIVVHNDLVQKAALQLFVYGNELTRINHKLFQLKNLTVLSLRNNRLTFIPPEIALLENLVELSLGNNQLKYIPAELLRSTKLSTLSLAPNPYLPLPDNKSHRSTIKSSLKSTRTLVEFVARTILNQYPGLLSHQDNTIPNSLLQNFDPISNSVNSCENCKQLFHVPDVEEMVWKTVFGNHHIPVLYRFCSIICCETFDVIEKISTNNIAQED